jgi:uncharacterized protein (TIGR02452 family)
MRFGEGVGRPASLPPSEPRRAADFVLGAWGCGAFANDPHYTAMDFRQALENEYSGAFSDIVFAITDWSPGRKFLGPFRDVFAANANA